MLPVAESKQHNQIDQQPEPVKVLMVCLGNICRSPTAHAVFEQLVESAGLQEQIKVDSAGTAAYHAGEPPDARSAAAAKHRDYDMSSQRARQVEAKDFAEFDYLIAMDFQNLVDLQDRCPDIYDEKPKAFLEFANPEATTKERVLRVLQQGEVPDPYYSGSDGFELVLDLVEMAALGLLDHIRKNDLDVSE